MANVPSPGDDRRTSAGRAECGAARGRSARRLPLPVPLLMQLMRPLNTMEDVQALAAQLASARARGWF